MKRNNSNYKSSRRMDVDFTLKRNKAEDPSRSQQHQQWPGQGGGIGGGGVPGIPSHMPLQNGFSNYGNMYGQPSPNSFPNMTLPPINPPSSNSHSNKHGGNSQSGYPFGMFGGANMYGQPPNFDGSGPQGQNLMLPPMSMMSEKPSSKQRQQRQTPFGPSSMGMGGVGMGGMGMGMGGMGMGMGAGGMGMGMMGMYGGPQGPMKLSNEYSYVSTIPGEPKLHQCNICYKSFKKKEHAKRHVRLVHKQERPYACNVCNMRFGTKQNYRSHMTTQRHEQKAKRARANGKVH